MSSFNFASCIFLPLSKYTVNMKTKSGYNYKIILASVLFIVITAVKLLFPAQTEDLRARLREVVSRDADYTAVFESLGEKLSGGAEWAAAFLLGQDETRAASAPVVYEPVTLDDLRREAGYLIAESPEPGETASPTPTPTPTPTPEPAVTETPEAVAAFLEAQAQFSDYAVPSNVSYEMPRLPFEFEAPSQATLPPDSAIGCTRCKTKSSSTTAPTLPCTPVRTFTPSPTEWSRSWGGTTAMETM